MVEVSRIHSCARYVMMGLMLTMAEVVMKWKVAFVKGLYLCSVGDFVTRNYKVRKVMQCDEVKGNMPTVVPRYGGGAKLSGKQTERQHFRALSFET